MSLTFPGTESPAPYFPKTEFRWKTKSFSMTGKKSFDEHRQGRVKGYGKQQTERAARRDALSAQVSTFLSRRFSRRDLHCLGARVQVGDARALGRSFRAR